MAFRGYELNLMLRVQDRATTRIRRLSHDLGGLSRAAALQRQGARLATAQNRNAISQAKTLELLDHRTNAASVKRLGYQSRLLRLKAQEVTLSNALASMKPGPARTAAEMRLAAVEKDILRTTKLQHLEKVKLKADAAEQLALEKSIGAQITANNAAYARAVRAENFQRRARTATHIGSAAFMAGGIGLLAAGGVSASFASFNRQAVAAATQMRGVNESFTATTKIAGVLQTGLLDLTRQFPASGQEMADSIYDIASGMDFQIDRTSRLTETQQRFNQSMKLLKLANQVAVAGNLDLATATDALIRVFNNFDPSLQSPIRVLNELFATVRFGKGTFAEFSPQIGRLASAANAAGQTLIETGGALAFLSQRLPLPQATTALVRIFQIIGRKEFTTGFQELFKVSPFKEGTRRLKDLSELMFVIETQGPRIWKGFTKGGVDLMNVLQNITAAGQNAMKGTTDAVGLVSTEFARRAITNFIVFGEQYRSVLEDVGSTQGEFIKSYQAFRNQPGVRWQIAINQFKAFAIVIGQDVLPVLLKFIDRISALAHRYEDLSPHTRKLISQFATWGAIATFLGGIILTLGGAAAILIGSLGGLSRILGMTGGSGVVGRFGMLLFYARGLLAIGTITIGIQLLKKGDNKLWSTILGSAAQIGGAALLGGKLGGWPGAAMLAGLTAYSIPLQMAAAEMKKQGIVSEKTVNEEVERIKKFQAVVAKSQGTTVAGAAAGKARTILIRAVYRQEGLQGIKDTEKYMKTTLTKMQQNLVNYARTSGMSHAFYQAHKADLDKFLKDNTNATQTVLQKWQELATQLTGIDLFGQMGQQAAQAAANISLNVARAQASGNEAAMRKAYKAQIAWDKAEAARLEKLPKTAARVKALIQIYNDLAAATAALEALDKKATSVTEKENRAKQLAAEKARSRNEALREQTNKITQAADNLVQKYKELETANKAAFQIFGGPISRGPIAQIYNNINQMLMGFGRKPIPIPIKLQIQDISAQVANFQRFVQDLAALRKRGVPAELISELQAKGPDEGLAIVEGLRNAGKGATNQYVKIWKQGQTLVKTTTNQQMNATLKQWQSYGKSIAWQIVQGLADDKTQATLKAGYRKYITDTFKSVLGKELSTAIGKKVGEYQTVQTAKDKKTPGKKAPGTKPEPTRTTQSHTTINYHGDEIKILASGATADAVYAAINRASFAKRHRL